MTADEKRQLRLAHRESRERWRRIWREVRAMNEARRRAERKPLGPQVVWLPGIIAAGIVE